MSERIDDGCLAFEEDLSAWIDGELPLPRAAALDAHVDACAACRRRAELLRAIDADLSRLDASTDPARIARIHDGIAARIHGDVVPLPAARRTPPRTRRWAAPLLAGAIGAAAAASLVLLVRPAPAPEAAVRERLVAARDFTSAPSAVPPELLSPKQKSVDAFAKSGAPAVDDAFPGTLPASPLEVDSARDLEMIERISSLSEAERRKLDRNLARWELLSPEERDHLRAQWRPAAAESIPTH
jgi:hypothetical protein